VVQNSAQGKLLGFMDIDGRDFFQNSPDCEQHKAAD
jgi:hypothetical protein